MSARWHPTTDGLRHAEHSMATKRWMRADERLWTACGLHLPRALASLDHTPPPKCASCEARLDETESK